MIEQQDNQTFKKMIYQSGQGIDFNRVNNRQNFVLSKPSKNIYFKANASSSINKEGLNVPESVQGLSKKLNTNYTKNEVAIELPVHEMKRLLDEMTIYRDYLNETISKENLKIVDVGEEKACFAEVENMISELMKEIENEGYDPQSLELLQPNNGINAEEYRKEYQKELDGELEEKIKEVKEIGDPNEQINGFENLTEFELVSNEKKEKLKLNSQIDIMNKRLDDVIAFLGEEADYVSQNNHGNLIKEVSHWYNIASVLDRHGLRDLMNRINILDKELDSVTNEKRMNFMDGEQRKALEDTLKDVDEPKKIKEDVEILMEKMNSNSKNIELMAKVTLRVDDIKETVESIATNTNENEEVLKTLEENLEANQAILEKNLKSFEERIKNLTS